MIWPPRPGRGGAGAAAAGPGYGRPAGAPARVRGATAARGGAAQPRGGRRGLGLRGVGPLERGDGDAPVSNRLRVMAERDGRIGMAGDLRHQPDLDALRLQVEMKEWRA